MFVTTEAKLHVLRNDSQVQEPDGQLRNGAILRDVGN